MNYPFIYEPTNCFSIFYTINLSTVTFGSFFCIILLLAHVDCNYFYFFGCHIYYSACIFTERAKHRSYSYFELLTIFGTLDTTFARNFSKGGRMRRNFSFSFSSSSCADVCRVHLRCNKGA